jgi:hypothetical protein
LEKLDVSNGAKIAIGVPILIMLLLLGFAFADERNRLFAGAGHQLRSGQMVLGVEIGQPIGRANLELSRRGFEVTDEYTVNFCGNHPLGFEETQSRYRDTTWRRGSLCVAQQGGRVTAMHVAYGMFIL